MSWLARVASVASLSAGFAQALSYLVPAVNQGWPRALAIVLPLLALTAINIIGVRSGANTAVVLVLAKMIPLGIFVGVGLFAVSLSTVSDQRATTEGGLAGAVLLKDVTGQPARPAQPATRVAVCDIVEVFDNYQRAKDLTQDLNDKSAKIKAENKQREKAIKAVQMEMENLKDGSPEYEKRLDQIQNMTIQRTAWLEFMTAKNMRNHHRLTKEMYNEMVAAVSQAAKELKCQVVFQRDRSKLQSNNTPELIRRISARKVIYAAAELDITEIVLGRLNMAYRATKKGD